MQEKSKRVRRDPAQARAEILRVAQSLFQEEGPDGIRIARIAKKMGVSHGTLLYHFKTTEALKEALYQEMGRAVDHDNAGAEEDLGQLVAGMDWLIAGL